MFVFKTRTIYFIMMTTRILTMLILLPLAVILTVITAFYCSFMNFKKEREIANILHKE